MHLFDHLLFHMCFKVCEVAEKVIWNCLVEDPTLFMRTFLEKLTLHQRQEELIFLLRKMLYHLKALPAQTAHCLFNYLVSSLHHYNHCVKRHYHHCSCGQI